MFPSPHSGILFLWRNNHADYQRRCTCVSVPSFGDSFFMAIDVSDYTFYDIVSVPSFGDSFFIWKVG